jgi:FkbH-like protein
MDLTEALQTLQAPVPGGAPPFRAFLACGFMPLHLATFLRAHLRRLLPGHDVKLTAGVYGDAAGNIARGGDADALVVALEWTDLDPRLGVRRLGGWGLSVHEEILESVRTNLQTLGGAISASSAPLVCLSLPTLPLPPVGITPGWQAGAFELKIRQAVATFAERMGALPHVRVLDTQRMDASSPPAVRFDAASEILIGFPYAISHASALGELLARPIAGPAPKKGIVTDLDDTLWLGIAGEAGPDGVFWDLDHRGHIHGLYQQFLSALAEEGALVGVASKNAPSVVEEVFRRKDILLGRDKVWPVEAGWGPKSESVGRILKAWNIAPAAVVFVDDSPMELAEIRRAYPEIETRLFPRRDYAAVYQLLQDLRDQFGKGSVSREDSLRSNSLRIAQEWRAWTETPAGGLDSFLKEAKARLSLDFRIPPESRALELINKTNQFNLNGRRFTDGEWRNQLLQPGAVALVARYEDKFGPLGKIAALAGWLSRRTLSVRAFVLSCRAFSRRIEHQCLQELFRRYELEEIVFDYAETPRNGPLREFLASLTGEPPAPGVRLGRDEFQAACPALSAEIETRE